MASTKRVYRFPQFDFLHQEKLWTHRSLDFSSDLVLGSHSDILINHANFADLLKLSRPSDVGMGRETTFNPEVRSSKELILDEEDLDLHPQFFQWLQSQTDQMSLELKHPAKVKIHPYKLILYQEGDFFNEHIDSIHDKGQIMTLSVSIPISPTAIPLDGGNLEIEGEMIPHPGPDKIGLTLFYHDACHKVNKVKNGERIVLIFNVLTDHLPDGALKLLPVFGKYWEKFTQGIAHLRSMGIKRIGFLANHLYMINSKMSSDLLKGVDLVGYLLFKQLDPEPYLEQVANDGQELYFKALLDIDQGDTFGVAYNEIEPEEEEEGKPELMKPTLKVETEYDQIKLESVEHKDRAIAQKYLMGQIVVLESSGRVQKRFSGNDEIYLGNEGFGGSDIWTDLGIFATI